MNFYATNKAQFLRLFIGDYLYVLFASNNCNLVPERPLLPVSVKLDACGHLTITFKLDII